jgi:hypothetical protein
MDVHLRLSAAQVRDVVAVLMLEIGVRRRLVPNVHAHLQKEGVAAELYATQWFLTLAGRYLMPPDAGF